MGKNLLDKIKVTPLKIIKMSTGNIMRVLKKNELNNRIFGEAYFSKIKSGKVRAWKYHLKMTLNLVVPHGKVKFVFYSQKNKHFKLPLKCNITLVHSIYKCETRGWLYTII